nr:MAG TPA: Tail fiber protein [Caudoviricetes sp.]
MAAGDKIFLADKPTLDRVDSNIGSRDSGEQTVFERLADLETKMAAMQTFVNDQMAALQNFVTDQMGAMTETIGGIGTVIDQSLNFDAVNSDRDKPLNVYILETVYALKVNDESIDWIFRQQGGVGFFLWSYFKLPEGVKAEIVPLGTISAVAASATAMQAVAASATAMQAVAASATAMQAVAASAAAMNAIGASKTARDAIFARSAALSKVQSSSMAIAKFAIGCAGKSPSSYADIAAVVKDTAAMSAIAGSSTAMSAIAGSSTAMSAIAGSSTAMSAIRKSSKTVDIQPAPGTIYSGKGILISIKCYSGHTSDRSFNLSGKLYGPGKTSITTGSGQAFAPDVETDNIMSFNNLSYAMTNSSYSTYPIFKVYKI